MEETTRIAPAPEREAAVEAATGATTAERPQLADGIELIGEYEDSGFREAPYIARRADGQIIQMPKLLYFVAEEADGRTTVEKIAERVSGRFGRGLDGDGVQFLIEEKLRPLGVLAGADGASPPVEKADPLLALKFRAALVPERAVRAITGVFYPLYFPPVVVAVLGGLVALDVWLFAFHGVAQSARTIVYDPILLLLVLGLVVLSAMFHECGHATACRYGGATPGAMGAGLYIVWPALYTDVTDAYRLGKGGRLRTDLGGVYFNVIFSLATYAAYFVTRFEPLLLVVVIQHLEILHQFLPFLRLDGYYILSDLTGVPDMFTRIRPTLVSLLPWREADGRVKELKPWVRFTVTAWVLVLVPIILFMFGAMLVNAPRVFATVYDSLLNQKDAVSSAIGQGDVLAAAAGVVQITVLVLPAAGTVVSIARVGTRSLAGSWRWSAGAPLRRAFVVLVAGGAASLLGYVWYPNGDYQPIQPGERGTIQGAAKQLASVSSGRPGLTPTRQRQLGGAKTTTTSGTSPTTTAPTSTTSTETTSTATDTTSTETTSTSTTETTTTSTTATSTTSTATTSTTP